MISLRESNRFDELISDKIKSAKNFERFYAIDSRVDPLEVCKANGYRVNLVQYPGHFHRCTGAYGCSISHFELYKKIAAHGGDDFFCILEDDVCHDAEPIICKSLVSCPSHIKSLDGVNFVNLIHNHKHSSAAYLLKPSAAQALIDISNNTITRPHDKFLFTITQNCPDIKFISIPCVRLRPRWLPRDLILKKKK
jgi:GR25 family glycosyltransferase involved in LPS biosynthesis